MTDGEKLDALHAAVYQGPREAVDGPSRILDKAVGRLPVDPCAIRRVIGFSVPVSLTVNPVAELMLGAVREMVNRRAYRL